MMCAVRSMPSRVTTHPPSDDPQLNSTRTETTKAGTVVPAFIRFADSWAVSNIGLRASRIRQRAVRRCGRSPTLPACS